MEDRPNPEETRSGVYRRSSTSLEFDRVIFFSDAVFAIAMTLLVVGIGIPHVADARLNHALGEKRQEITSFFISFVVIGFYWLSHHQFVAHLRAIDRRFMKLNLLYLAVIAFAPFPTALVGVYDTHAFTIVMYAITLGTATSLESVLFWHAYKFDLLDLELSPESFRYNILASLAPVLVFALSIPIAFVVNWWALLTWPLIFPLEAFVDRVFKPDDAPEL